MTWSEAEDLGLTERIFYVADVVECEGEEFVGETIYEGPMLRVDAEYELPRMRCPAGASLRIVEDAKRAAANE